MLVTKNRIFIKHFALRNGTSQTLGKGLLTSEGDFWRKQRRLAQPAFHRERIAAQAGMMVEFAERMLRDWSDGQPRDAQEDMMQLTLQIVAKALFDADVSGEAADASAAMDVALKAYTVRVSRVLKLPTWVPTPLNIRTRRAVGRLDGIIYRIIAARRASGEDRGDLLSMLLHAQDEDDGGRMTDRQLRDEAMTLFMAGHETTANTLAWVWYLLATHPEVEAKLHSELDSVLDDRPPGFDDLPRLTYAEQVVTEALRLYPTVWILGREATEPCEVGGYHVPVGRTIFMSQWVIHRDPRFFDDPLSYRPRAAWADGLAKRLPLALPCLFPVRRRAEDLHRERLRPHGIGPAPRDDRPAVSAGGGAPTAVEIKPLPTMTLRPEHGVKVILSRRRPG